MVFKKRLDPAINGFRVPTIPRAPRSVRRRRPLCNKVEDGRLCAFELLASIAGKLLQESESSASSNASERSDHATGKNVKQEHQVEDKPFKEGWIYQGRCGDGYFAFEVASQNICHKSTLKESCSHADSDGILECNSIINNSDCSRKVSANVSEFGTKYSEVEGGSSHFGESFDANVNNEIERQQEVQGLETEGANTCSSKDSMELCQKPTAVINTDSNVGLPLCEDTASDACFSRYRNDVMLGSRDDDENFSRCFKPRTKAKDFRSPSRIAERRIKKFLTSRYWKAAPKLKDCELSRSDGGLKQFYHKRKPSRNRERYQRDMLFKKRKMFDQSSVVISVGGFSSESVSNSSKKGMTEDKDDSAIMLHGANGVKKVSSSVIGHVPFHSKDSHVKFSIKSFKVPELLIDVPETTTVGSLKRTVMGAVTSVLGGGLCVEVLLQGKKVRDDNRTLLQTGISSKDNLDSLGFELEPSIVQTPPPLCSSDFHPILSCDSSPLLTRFPGNTIVEICDPLVDPSVMNSGSHVESGHEIVSSHIDTTDKSKPDSQALVALPAKSMEALTLIPLNQKTRHSELAQRRTRRPFSVSEVESLVHAVEKLGTGRTNGKHWFTQQESPRNREGESLFPRNYWIESWLLMLTGLNIHLSNIDCIRLEP
ncbi:telomere repeat-binding protein 4-like isoform X1 [Carya illinoinensis]|uniref:Telomere repeat-binding protein 1-6-like ubiquitin-like domain-containing protein n=1 Tax=Carya illinoinensis TaxID=32201 RepID=A0A8T1RIX6_CARIL|nr:telomere repeat-binding protein 4-like isoform X1 [Carya illinoinensis]KAG6665801.1 hypothetical protein CIPAW_02G185100 [Carya illinoinensis]